MPQTTSYQGDLKTGPKPPTTVKPAAEWGSTYSPDDGFTVRVADKFDVYVFLDQRLIDVTKRDKLLDKVATIAHVIGRLPALDWRVDAEPIDGGQVGLCIYTHRGKALMAGTGVLKPNGFVFKLATIYPSVTNFCKLTAKVTVEHTSEDGRTKTKGTVGGTYTSAES